MFNLFSRMKRLFSIKGNKTLKKYEDTVEVYEYELKKSKDALDNLEASQSKMRAQRRVIEDKKAKAIDYLNSLERVLDRAIEQNDDEIGEETMGVADSTRKKIETFDTSIQSYTYAIQNLEQQYAGMKERYNDKLAKLDGLRAQSEFAKNMEVINTELKTHYAEGQLDYSSFEKLEEELKGKIYLEQEKNLRLSPGPSLEERVGIETKKSRFEEYKAAKQAKLDAPSTEDEGKQRQLDAIKLKV